GDYKDAPPLFSSAPVICPDLPADTANVAIDGWLRDAAGRHERSPFSAEDGVEAVTLYRRAASCMRRYDRVAEADELTVEADSLAQRLQRDFHVHRVRLSRALTSDDTATARREVGLLHGYIAGRQGEFGAWLDYLDRRLGLQGKVNDGHG
ncbi:MAG TPA: hypothetical protein VNW92_00890, partial [Polyangiaceae bacterium]|nr:hypothetical protein [Polyangiaceae bacterium]